MSEFSKTGFPQRTRCAACEHIFDPRDEQALGPEIVRCPNCESAVAVHNQASAQQMSVITVRMPLRLHDDLRQLAHGRDTSLNKLCTETLQSVVLAAKQTGELPEPVAAGSE